MKKEGKKLISTIIPLFMILILGGVVGNYMSGMKQQKDAIKSNMLEKETKINEIENIVEETNKISKDIETQNGQTTNQEKQNEQKQNEAKQKIQNIQIDLAETQNEQEKTEKQINFDKTVAFIGDSRTQGFIMYNNLKDVINYSYVGFAVDTAITKPFVKNESGNKITILEDMKNRKLQKVYIMLGINELGWAYPEIFRKKYCELIEEIRKIQPNCKIYVQSIIPVTKSKSDGDKIYNNTNIANYNNLIQDLAKEEYTKYLDIAKALTGSVGILPEEASTDGIHVNKKYCEKWLTYLKQNI